MYSLLKATEPESPKILSLSNLAEAAQSRHGKKGNISQDSADVCRESQQSNVKSSMQEKNSNKNPSVNNTKNGNQVEPPKSKADTQTPEENQKVGIY